MKPELLNKIKSLTGASTLLDACALLTIEDFCSLPIDDRASIRRIINANVIHNDMDRRRPRRWPYRFGHDCYVGGTYTAAIASRVRDSD